jgi:glycosyltransferase involved in cell wall biosynthesis
VTDPRLTALIRCRDEERGIGSLIDALRAQTMADAIQIVVIDSGSRDGTLDEVRRRGIEPLQIRPDEFTYGRALNLAAAEAAAPICLSISAHVRLPDNDWAHRLWRAFAEDRVACAYGPKREPESLRPLSGPILQDLALAEQRPLWGYSNSSGAFRRDLWRQRPFDERLRADEDLEWAWYWLQRGWLVLLDPALAVHHSHADEGPMRTFRRRRTEAAAVHSFREVDPLPLGAVLSEWWRGPHLHRSNLRARLDPQRMAALAGRYTGLRWP